MTTTTTEPWFLEDDTEAVLEYMRERAATCSGCGLPRDETTAKPSQFRYDAEPIRCHACAARERAHDSFLAEGGQPEGLLWAVHDLHSSD